MKRLTVDYGKDVTRAVPVEEPIEGNTKQALQRATRKSADPMEILRGVTEAYTADQIRDLLHTAELLAVEQKSWEGLIAIVKLSLEYSVGKPVQRSVSATVDPAEFMKHFID